MANGASWTIAALITTVVSTVTVITALIAATRQTQATIFGGDLIDHVLKGIDALDPAIAQAGLVFGG